jgi:DNA-binding CsgD family transcriptional regulator
VTKSSPPEQLVQAVRAVHAGRRVISPDIASEVTAALVDVSDAPAPSGLSPREFEVLRALAAGRSPADIANTLHLSIKTVHNLHYQVKSKLGVSSDFELARLAWQRGWLSPGGAVTGRAASAPAPCGGVVRIDAVLPARVRRARPEARRMLAGLAHCSEARAVFTIAKLTAQDAPAYRA